MRIVLIGIGHTSVEAARRFVDRGDEVIFVDPDQEAYERRAQDLDVAFIQGDGSRPGTLKQVDPRHVDVLFCLTDDDQDNILAALVGRSLGIERVVPKIDDPEFRPICLELGLEETINPDLTIARALVHLCQEDQPADLAKQSGTDED